MQVNSAKWYVISTSRIILKSIFFKRHQQKWTLTNAGADTKTHSWIHQHVTKPLGLVSRNILHMSPYFHSGCSKSWTSLLWHHPGTLWRLDFTIASFLAFVCSLKSQFWIKRVGVWVEQISRKAAQLRVSHLSIKQPSDIHVSHYEKGNSNVGPFLGYLPIPNTYFCNL